jgi:hypothetical protein
MASSVDTDGAALLSDLGGLTIDPMQKTIIMLMERTSALEDRLNAMAARESTRDAVHVRLKTIEALASDLGRGSIWRVRDTGMTLEQFRDKVSKNISAAAARRGGRLPGFECVVLATRCGSDYHMFMVLQADWDWVDDKSATSADASASWIDALGAVRSAVTCTELMIPDYDTSNEDISDRFESLVKGNNGTIWCGWMDQARPGQMLWERGQVGKAVCDSGEMALHQPRSPWASLSVSRLTLRGGADTNIMPRVIWYLCDEPSSAEWAEDGEAAALLTAAQSTKRLSDEDMRIVLRISRYGRDHAVIVVRPPHTTVGGVLNAIHAFYHAPRTLTDFQRLPIDRDDPYDLVQGAITDLQDGKGPRSYYDVRGDATYFQGLHRLKDGTFTAWFAS